MREAKSFVDTNILIYMFSGDAPKVMKVYSYLTNYRCMISMQVVMEFCSVCTRKLHFSRNELKGALIMIRKYCDERQITDEAIDRAIDVHARYGYSFYDSVMIASAIEHGCQTLASEDM